MCTDCEPIVVSFISVYLITVHRRSQEFVLDGPDNGAEIETPKVSRGKGMGRGSPPLQRTRRSGAEPRPKTNFGV